MTISPIAIGIDVVPTEILDKEVDNDGMPQPINIPSAIAENIQSVKYLSKNDNLDDLLLILTPPLIQLTVI
jgi:hypothetical protein